MKRTLLTLLTTLILSTGFSQLKVQVKCPTINVDLLNGNVNHIIIPTSNIEEIKKNLPCFTSFTTDIKAKCGSTVSYKDQDITFYVSRNYVEIGPHFKGVLSVPLMGASRNNLFRTLGDPQIKQPSWDAFKTSYGILILYYNKANKVDKIQFSTQSASTIKLCE
ncbi:MAG: hypothetical protein ACTHK8_06865 [Ginsengibacter sp.]